MLILQEKLARIKIDSDNLVVNTKMRYNIIKGTRQK